VSGPFHGLLINWCGLVVSSKGCICCQSNFVLPKSKYF
jgi:hypothetical protein